MCHSRESGNLVITDCYGCLTSTRTMASASSAEASNDQGNDKTAKIRRCVTVPEFLPITKPTRRHCGAFYEFIKNKKMTLILVHAVKKMPSRVRQICYEMDYTPGCYPNQHNTRMMNAQYTKSTVLSISYCHILKVISSELMLQICSIQVFIWINLNTRVRAKMRTHR